MKTLRSSKTGCWRAAFYRQALAVAAVLVALASTGVGNAQALTLRGAIQSNAIGLAGYEVSLYASPLGRRGWIRLGGAATNAAGGFQMNYHLPWGVDLPSVLIVKAVRGPSMLASAIGLSRNPPTNIVVNERTTVATGVAFAQFIHGASINGNVFGLANAVFMAANLANPRTGAVGVPLAFPPNGGTTTTLRTFNSLANVVASCVAAQAYCTRLFRAATPPGGAAPTNVLQAISNIIKNPSYVRPDGSLTATDPLFSLSKERPIYTPFLLARPTNWLLFLKITGGFYSAQNENNLMNGPGNVAIDERGYVWVNDNYVPRSPGTIACAGRRLMKFYPWGKSVPGSPFFGGGLSGAGYGITLDPKGRVWVGNFGFQDPPCALVPRLAAPNNSVSLFRSDGTPISGVNGFTQGDISWPQGTVSDRQGNIWVGNCGNDSVTKIPNGRPSQAFNIPLGATPPDNRPQIKPFGVVVDLNGYVWVNNNRNDTVSVISPAGKLIETLPGTFQGRAVLSHPMGNAADTKGNIWIANSDWVDVPCPTRFMFGTADNPTITMYRASNRKPYPGSPFAGGGLTMPWGVAVDGDDIVWIFNFGAVPPGQKTNLPTGISRFCGVSTDKCPPGFNVGQPISPNTGYRSNALARITGGQIDRSGNIWVVANWKIDANPFLNPGGNSIAIVIGAAAPIQTPLIGPPVPIWRGQ
jgi:hypothetical protein